MFLYFLCHPAPTKIHLGQEWMKKTGLDKDGIEQLAIPSSGPCLASAEAVQVESYPSSPLKRSCYKPPPCGQRDWGMKENWASRMRLHPQVQLL